MSVDGNDSENKKLCLAIYYRHGNWVLREFIAKNK